MLTPQDINEKGFDKAVFNGYDMGDVDDFLEVVSNDYNALYKENAILKGKLKVLVEKVEEYRATEDSMRMALLNAQKMGDEITIKANKERDEILQRTDEEVKATLGDVEKRCADEETRLALATKETAKFIELSQAIMRKHAEFLDKLENARRVVKSPKGGSTRKPAQNKTAASTKAAPAQNKAAPAQGRPATPQQGTPAQSPTMRAPKPAGKPAIPAGAKHVAPVRSAPPPGNPPAPPQATRTIPTVPTREADIDDIALQIGSIVEDVSDENIAVAPPSAPPSELMSAPQSLFEDDLGSSDLFADDGKGGRPAASPRPKFDFDDLKFGANFDLDE